MAQLPDASEPPPARVAPVILPRWVQLVLLPLAIIGIVAVLQAAGPVVLLFIIAAIIALLLNPFVALLRRTGLPRGPSVLVVMLCVVCVVVVIGVLVANPVSEQVSAFQRNVPDLIDDANASLADFQTWLDDNGIGLQVKDEGQTALATLGERLTEGSGEVVSFTSDALVRLVEASIALILIVVLTVYMLLYGERIGALIRSVMPPGDGSRADDFPARVQAAVFGYVRGQLLFSVIMGTSAGVLLWVFGSLGIFPDGKTYALFFGAWYGFAELIPYVGPAIGAAPPVLIALFSGEPLDAVWLVIAFTALQQIEGHIVAPTVFSQALRINPLLVIFALLLGGQIYGFIGAFIALPIAAILRETAVYLRRHVRLEPWDLPWVTPAVASFGAESTASVAAAPARAPAPTTGESGGGSRSTDEPRADEAARSADEGPDGASTSAEGEATEAEPDAAPTSAEGEATEAEPESTTRAQAGAQEGPGAQAGPGARERPGAHEGPRCPECGAPRPAGAERCPACGTELGSADEEASATASAPQ